MKKNTRPHPEFFSISTPTFGDDFTLLQSVVNIGIDSHLEGFTQSEFFFDCGNFYFHFHNQELSVLLRRLIENDSDNALLLVDDIVNELVNTPVYNQTYGCTNESTWI